MPTLPAPWVDGGRIPQDMRFAVRAAIRTTFASHAWLAGQVGISRPQLTKVIAGRSRTSLDIAQRLYGWAKRTVEAAA